ncbi:uncharacterized protein DUF4184 [Haloactinospora alba]|uniref:Uncharacterized protein DUF4184 n=1 Tax=Haloactinospora alba TaxID=405555 RepID=A0A543NGA0_9ACTN|nr:DUF4184 family protein [Haloactinospora alba]TQN30876.1 uncharacterized protein DUF4184 [Haloactinospora alba]
MPFTASHPAAVLPLGALLAGAVAPGLPYYLHTASLAATTHGPRRLGGDVASGAGALLCSDSPSGHRSPRFSHHTRATVFPTPPPPRKTGGG